MRFFRNAASVLLTSAVLLPVGLATTVVMARLLDVPSLGLYSAALNLSFVVVILAQLGWESAVIYRIRHEGADPAQVLSSGLVAMLTSGAIAVIVFAALESPLLQHVLPGASRAVLYLALAIVPFQLLGLVLAAIARGLDRFDLHNGYRLGRALGVLVAVTLVLGVAGGSLIEALAAIVAVQVLATAAVFVPIARLAGIRRALGRTELAASLRFGYKTYLQSLAGQVHERLDLFMIAYFLEDAAQIAIYAIAVRVIQTLVLLPESLGASLFPKAAGLAPDEAGRFTAYVSRHSFLWVVLAAVGLGVIAPWLIPFLYGEAYAASVPPLQVLLCAMALLTIYRILSRYFIAVGRQRVNITTQVVATGVNIVLNIWWIPLYGIMGAALASLVSYALEALLITTAFTRAASEGLRDTLVLQRADLQEYRSRAQLLLDRLGWVR